MLVLLLAACSSVVAREGMDKPRGTAHDLNIVEETLDRALMQLARQTKTQLLFDYERMRSYPAPRLTGRQTLEQALRILLDGTPYAGSRSGDVVTIVPEQPSNQYRGVASMQDALNRKNLSVGIAAAIAALLGGTSEVRAQDSEKAKDLDAVVVTADRRGEKLLIETPVAISAYDGTWLEDRGYHAIKDFLQLSPGVSMFEHEPGDNRIQMRGVSVGVGEANVGYYIDEVPMAFINQTFLPDVRSFDMDRIEVLRGPQSTLYGAGALAGVVRSVTRSPSLASYEFKSDLSYSSTQDGGDNHALNFAGNIPLVQDRVGLRMVYTNEDNAGWLDRAGTGEKDFNSHSLESFRLKLLAQLTDGLSVSAMYLRSDIDSNGGARGFRDRTDTQAAETPSRYNYEIANITFDYEGENFGLVSSTSRSSIDNVMRSEFLMGETLDTLLDPVSFTQEVRAYSRGDGDWQWSAGAFYRDADQTQIQTSDLMPVLGLDPTMQYDEVRSRSVFAEVTRRMLGGKLDATLGGRYLCEERSTEQKFRPSTPFVNEFSAFTPRFNLTYRPADNWMTYFNYSEGFRSGINQFAVSLETAEALGVILPTAASPEDAKSYEIGVKGLFFDNRLTADIAVFRIDWKDMQALVPIVVDSLVGVVNAASATSPGVEVALNWKATDNFRFGVTASWNDARFGSDVLNKAVIPGDPNGATRDVVVFRKGDRINDVPEWTAGLTADYVRPVFDERMQFVVRGATQYTSVRENRSQDVVARGDRILATDLRVGIENTRWGIHLFANNLFDEDGMVMAYAGSDPGRGLRIRPRTIGLNVKFFY